MTMKTYSVTLGGPGGATREVRVPSPTDVQAGDAARPLMQEGESIVTITEITGDSSPPLDAAPPKSQAAELAPVTPGVAAAYQPDTTGSDDHG